MSAKLKRRVSYVAGAAVIALALWLRLGPLPPIDPASVTSPTIVDRNGVVLYEPLSPKQTRGEWITAKEIPERVAQATVAAEDKRFYRHIGIDPIAVARAAVHDVRALRIVEGGSTISQQVAKLLLPKRNKLLEAVIALRLEHRYSKREILALYLNLAPYGNEVNGIARASRRWFGCGPENLTTAQAAFLAALPQRPNERAARARQPLVLRRMVEQHFITKGELAVARNERLRFDRGTEPLIAAHFVERVRDEVARRGPAFTTGRTIQTTLDAALQRDVRGIINAQRANLLRHGAHSAAVAVLDNATGEWLAWEGSGDYFGPSRGESFGGAIDGVTTLRQPGSALKPFTYSLAFEQGFSPSTVLADVPSSFPTAEEGVIYTPRNYDGRYRGPLRARFALAGSENVPAVAMLARVGPPSLLRLLRRAGFRNLDRTADYYGLGLTLGDAEVTLEQLVTAYAIFARGGQSVVTSVVRCPLSVDRCSGQGQPTSDNRQLTTANEERTTADGQRPTENGQRPARILSPRTAFWITDILSDPDARAYAFGNGGSLDFPFPVAVKTGTSQAYRDNWTVGYTRDVTVGVWVGNFDRSELRNSSGVTGAGPIFHSVMLAAMKGKTSSDVPIVEPPPGLERAPVCALSGLRPSTSCPNVETEWVASDAPVEFCSWHHDGWVDWPSEYRDWARVEARATIAGPAHPTARDERLRILSPPNGATYLIDPTLRMAFQTLPLRASDPRATFHIDGRAVAARSWPLAPGKHTVLAEVRGKRDEVTIYVK
jgi:penicillin-binding protein 1C